MVTDSSSYAPITSCTYSTPNSTIDAGYVPYSGSCSYNGTSANLYDDFIKTLEDNNNKERPIMTHLPSNIRKARMIFEGYLAEEELQERQFSGRFWEICQDLENPSLYRLFIILDNDTVLWAEAIASLTKEVYIVKEAIYKRDDIKQELLQSLRGRFYDFRLYD